MIMANKIINWIANEFKNNVKQWVGDAVQSAKNFIGWFNDTMNMPATMLWTAVANLAPKGTKLQKAGEELRNTSEWTSDMWQNYWSAWYLAGRVAPWLAVYWALPAWATAVASSPALLAWVETAWISSLASVPNIASGRADRRRWVKRQVMPKIIISKAAEPISNKDKINATLLSKKFSL